jgi:hypothetical protein
MASYREMDAVGRDRARFVLMCKRCLLFPDLDDRERQFLTDLIYGNEMMGGKPDCLSTRQAEWLFEIRDKYELHSTLHDGFSVAILIRLCYEARLDLDEYDEKWITEIRKAGRTKLTNAECGRLRRCATQIGAIEQDDAA